MDFSLEPKDSPLTILKNCHTTMVLVNKETILRDWTPEEPFHVCLHATDQHKKHLPVRRALEFISKGHQILADGHPHPDEPNTTDHIQLVTTVGDTFMFWNLYPATGHLYQIGDIRWCADKNCKLHYPTGESASSRWLKN